jgi:hypothetical protein
MEQVELACGCNDEGNTTLMMAFGSRSAICTRVMVYDPISPFLLEDLEMRLVLKAEGVVMPLKEKTLVALAMEEPSEKWVKTEKGETGWVVGGFLAALRMEKVRLVPTPAAVEGKGLVKLKI